MIGGQCSRDAPYPILLCSHQIACGHSDDFLIVMPAKKMSSTASLLREGSKKSDFRFHHGGRQPGHPDERRKPDLSRFLSLPHGLRFKFRLSVDPVLTEPQAPNLPRLAFTALAAHPSLLPSDLTITFNCHHTLLHFQRNAFQPDGCW
jgi:hypothetical protein